MQPELQQSNDADTSCKKMQRWDRQSSRCKKNAIGTGDCKKKRSNHQIAKKKAMWQTKCKKKRCDQQSVKKKRWNGQSAKKMQCDRHIAKKKRCDRQSVKKKAMGRAKCKKKAMERAKCKKNATGQLVVSRIWESSQQDETTKPRLAALVFFFCVCLCVCGSAYSSAAEAMIRTARRVQYPAFLTCQHKTPQMHDWHVFFFSSLWEKGKKGTHLKNGSPYKSVVLAGPAYRRSWNWTCVKKRKMKVAFF